MVEGENPASGHRRKVKNNSYQAFTEQELISLFVPVPDIKERWEIPLVSLYSGMRLNEICHLEWSNIHKHNGIPYIDITHSKSKAGERQVPIHPRIQFLFEGGGDGYIWKRLRPSGPDKKRGHQLSGNFTEHREQRGVARDGQRVAFHSFRKNFVDRMARLHIPQNVIKAVIGHEQEFTFRVYDTNGPKISEGHEAVKQISYPEFEAAWDDYGNS